MNPMPIANNTFTLIRPKGDGNYVSAIQVVAAENQPHKVYSLSGQRLAAPRKGVNIIGRKKVIVK